MSEPGLRERARLQFRQAKAERDRRDEEQQRLEQRRQRTDFGAALGMVLRYPWDTTKPFPDEEFPGALEIDWDGPFPLVYREDGLRFSPSTRDALRTVLLIEACPKCGRDTAGREVRTLVGLGEALETRPNCLCNDCWEKEGD